MNIKASKLGLKKRYEYNHDYFECIDSEDKAYWLGFIWADGLYLKMKKLTQENCLLNCNYKIKNI